MVDQAAHWMDHVLPDVPVRQWVLSLPHEIRYRIAFDPKLQSEVRGVFMRAVQSWIKRRMRDLGFPGGRTGGVACVQRFDSALRLDPHIHALVLDGVYIGLEDGGEATFHPLPKPSDEDIEKLVRSLHGRVYGLLRRRGVLHDGESEEVTTLGVCQAAAVQGRIPFGEEAGGYDQREGRRRGGVAPRAKRRLCADYEGFSLHAAIRVPAGQRARLERLSRYVLRSAIDEKRLSLTSRGRVRYAFKKEWRDGSSAVEMSLMTFLSRLAALIPAPRVNLVTYHGLLAPAASYRDRVVPTVEGEMGESCVKHQGAGGLDGRGIGTPKPKERKKRLLWAEAMKRGLDLDVLKCGHCGGRREVLKCITDPKVIDRILTHLGLKTVLPEVAPARAPPGSELLFEY